MTDTELVYTPSDLGFSHPLDYHLVSMATPYIVENLNQLMATHSDRATRWADARRTHPQLEHSQWFAFYRKNQVVITNRLDSKQFQYLNKGNGVGQICAKHKSYYRGADGQVKSKPGVLKFYDKRDGMWKYRSCVRTIHSDIIDTFNTAMRRAIFQGLEQARWEMMNEKDVDPDIFTVSESQAANAPVGTLEEVHLENISAIQNDKKEEEAKEQMSIFGRLKAAGEKAYTKAKEKGSNLLGMFRKR